MPDRAAPRSSRCRRAWGGLLALLVGLALGNGSPARAAELSVTKEQRVKAAFLFNFTKFVEWPAARFQDADAPIVIGVLGPEPLAAALAETVKNRKVNGRGIQVRQISRVSEVKDLHALFVSGGEAEQIKGLGDALMEGSVLGVGESAAFLERGGTIMFAVDGDKLRFDIDMTSAERARLEVSSQLQKLARTVRRKP